MKHILLIGMPGSGKSSVGHILARLLGWPFTDTDWLIEAEAGMSLHDILMQQGAEGLRKLEHQILDSLHPTAPTVIATGGSAVFATEPMNRLRKISICVYLEVSLETVRQRIGEGRFRGIVRLPTQTLDEVFAEREILYRSLAHFTVNAEDGTAQEIAEALANRLSSLS